MKKEIRETTQAGTVQITTADERWYARPGLNLDTGLPEYQYVPSVTWIAGHYPKGIGFFKWLAQQGWDEATAVRQAAADKGSKIHQAIARLIDGETIGMDELIVNPTTGQPEPLTLEEYEACLSFVAWVAEAKPVTLARDFVVWGDGYAGTVDYLCLIDGVPWLIDFKSGREVWPEHRLQVSAYKEALPAAMIPEEVRAFHEPRLGILQVGYSRNRAGWKLTEVDDVYPLFLAAKQIWAFETSGQVPTKREYPLTLALGQALPSNGKPARKATRKTAEPVPA